MKTAVTMNCKLFLILTRRWFDRHLKDKREEYREITPYWCTRLLLVNGERKPKAWWEAKGINSYESLKRLVKREALLIQYIKYNTVVFSNGMKPVDVLPRFEKPYLDFNIGTGRKKWGAPLHPVFIIKCGELQNLVNYNE